MKKIGVFFVLVFCMYVQSGFSSLKIEKLMDKRTLQEEAKVEEKEEEKKEELKVEKEKEEWEFDMAGRKRVVKT